MASKIDDAITQIQAALSTLNECKEKKEIEDNYRVIQLKDNPFQKFINRQRLEIIKLKRENERISARLDLLESGNEADVTRKIEEVVNSAHEIETLKSKLDEYEKREAKILTSFKKTSREFREVCYLLTGYRIDALKDRIYRLSNMYAESPDDVLLFEISPHGEIQLLQNNYAERNSDFIATYLERGDSFPAFLSSITLDLYKSQTQVMQVSMNIDQTTKHVFARKN